MCFLPIAVWLANCQESCYDHENEFNELYCNAGHFLFSSIILYVMSSLRLALFLAHFAVRTVRPSTVRASTSASQLGAQEVLQSPYPQSPARAASFVADFLGNITGC